MIDPNVAIDVEHCRLVRRLHHPLFAKLGTPGKGLVLLRQMFELDAQGAYFWRTVDAEKLAPLTRRVIAQGFHRSEPGERHESQQQEDAAQSVKALRQAKVLAGM